MKSDGVKWCNVCPMCRHIYVNYVSSISIKVQRMRPHLWGFGGSRGSRGFEARVKGLL